jgi:hypothetical protein
VGVWVPHPPLDRGEAVRWRKNATRRQGSTRAVGGRLFLTDRRLLFQPSRFDQALRGEFWSTPLDQIRDIGVEGKDRQKANERDYGALRRRLRIVTQRSSELFVINSVEEVVRTLREGIFGQA